MVFKQVCDDIRSQYIVIGDLEGIEYDEVILMMRNLIQIDPTVLNKLELGLIQFNPNYKEYARRALEYVLEL